MTALSYATDVTLEEFKRRFPWHQSHAYCWERVYEPHVGMRQCGRLGRHYEGKMYRCTQHHKMYRKVIND